MTKKPTPAAKTAKSTATAAATTATPAVETNAYTDGTTATGTPPLPDQSPAQQDAAAGTTFITDAKIGTLDAAQLVTTGLTATEISVGTISAEELLGGSIVAAGNIPSAYVLIRPSVGRKVWYRPGPQDRHSHMQWIEGEPLDATILAVHGDRSINAQVLDINGTPFIRRSWPLVQQGDEKPDGSYFEWMPYQTGQAAKAV